MIAIVIEIAQGEVNIFRISSIIVSSIGGISVFLCVCMCVCVCVCVNRSPVLAI